MTTTEGLDAAAIRSALPSMRAFARGLTLSRESADDLVHRAILLAAKQPGPPRAVKSARLSLFGVVHDEFLRSRANPPTEAGTDWVGDRAASEIERAFGRLPSEEREALLLTMGARLSVGDAAKVVRSDGATLRRRADAARAQIVAAIAASRSGTPARAADAR